MSLFYTNETNTLKNHKEKVGDIMTSLKNANRRVGSLFAVAALVLATITPGLVPAFASAAQVTNRSVQLSSSSKEATNVTYQVDFKAVAAAGAFVVEFCENSPLIGAACDAPVGLEVGGASTTTGTWSVQETTAGTGNTLVATDPISAAEDVSVVIDGITNPDEAGTVYARVLTYADEATALLYQSETTGSYIDEGGAAFSITDTIGVSGAVLETMTFCVSGSAITTANCGGALTAPVVELGEGSGDAKALMSTAVSEGNLYSQLSTNAASGAVVNLKSSTVACGGLVRVGAANCDIAPATDGLGIEEGDALFGAKVAAAADPTLGNPAPSGTLSAASAGAFYSDSIFKLNWVSGDATGITSPYGDPFFDTAGVPASDKNVLITFGASVTNQTPAGRYAADLSLIATGKF